MKSERILEVLTSRIHSGYYRYKLPAVRALAAELEVNPRTILKVIRNLRDRNLVSPRPGSAVYIVADGGPLGPEKGAREPRQQGTSRKLRPGTRIGLASLIGTRIDANHPYYSGVIRGAVKAARSASLDLHLIPMPSYGHLGKDTDYFREQVLDAGIEGMISLSPRHSEIQNYLKLGIAFVICGGHTKLPPEMAGLRIPRLLTDMDAMARQATRRLVAAGHRRIAFVGRDGLYGFEQTMDEFGLDVPQSWRLKLQELGYECGYESCHRLLRDDLLPTALVVTDDFTCSGVLAALFERRLRVPDDLSIISHANANSDVFLQPLSTIEVDGQIHGQKYVKALCDELVRSPAAEPMDDVQMLPLRFVDRGSIACLRSPEPVTR